MQNFDYRAGGRFSVALLAFALFSGFCLPVLAHHRMGPGGRYPRPKPTGYLSKSLPPEYPEPPSRGSRSTLPIAMQQGGFPIELPEPPLPTVEPITGSIANGKPKEYRGSGRFES